MNTHLHILEPYTNLYRVWKDERLLLGFRSKIYVVPAEGGEATPLLDESEEVNGSSIAWSPAGDAIAYACSDRTIRIIPFRGGDPRIVIKDEGGFASAISKVIRV